MVSKVSDSINSTVLDVHQQQQELQYGYAEHPYCLQKFLHQQWIEQENCDLILCVNGGDIKAHAVVAACFSMTICSHLSSWEHHHGSKRKLSQFTPCGRPGLYWKKFRVDLDFCIVKELVSFMYTGLLSVESSKASEMLEAANMLGMTDAVGLLQVCQEQLLKSVYVPPSLDGFGNLLTLANAAGQDDVTKPNCSHQNCVASETPPLQRIIKVECLDDEPENVFSKDWRSTSDNMDGEAPVPTSVQDGDAGSHICDAEVANTVHKPNNSKDQVDVQPMTNGDGTKGQECSTLSTTVQRLHVSELEPCLKPEEESIYEQVKNAVEQGLKAETEEVDLDTESTSMGQPDVRQRSEFTLWVKPLGKDQDVERETSHFDGRQEASEGKMSVVEKVAAPCSPLCVCNICSQTSTSVDDLRRHPRSQQAGHKCMECHKAFRRKCDLTRHMRRHLKSPGSERDHTLTSEKKTKVKRKSQEGVKYLCNMPGCKFHCDKCPESFVEKNDLNSHLNLVHKRAAKVWKCLVCDLTFESSKKLRLHGKDAHNDPRMFPCDVQGCGYRAMRHYGLITHKATVHASERNFLCEKCGKRFPTEVYLQNHERSCLEQRDYLCSICGMGFKVISYLFHHVRVVHEGERKYVCKVCGKRFSHHSNLARHMLIHNNSFPYPCKKCGQKFRHSNSLKEHMSKVHSE